MRSLSIPSGTTRCNGWNAYQQASPPSLPGEKSPGCLLSTAPMVSKNRDYHPIGKGKGTAVVSHISPVCPACIDPTEVGVQAGRTRGSSGLAP